MNGDDRNSNGNVSAKTGILKHSSDGASNTVSTLQDGEQLEEQGKYQRSTATTSNDAPVMTHYDPPVRRYTSYGPHTVNHQKTSSSSKNCCIIT